MNQPYYVSHFFDVSEIYFLIFHVPKTRTTNEGPGSFSQCRKHGDAGRNYLPFQELTVEAPVPESYELVTSSALNVLFHHHHAAEYDYKMPYAHVEPELIDNDMLDVR